MAGLPQVSGELRIGSEPRSGYIPDSGVPFWNAKCVMAARKEEPKGSGNWIDDPNKELWLNVSVYRKLAENAMNSGFKKGDLITIGKADIYLRKYMHENEKRISVECEPREMGASLTFRTYPHHDDKKPAPTTQPPVQDGNAVDTPAWATPGSEEQQYGWGGGGGL